jgi:hypothetical protein
MEELRQKPERRVSQKAACEMMCETVKRLDKELNGNGQPGTGTLVVSWPSFTTASGQLVTAASTTMPIAPDGFVSVSLAPNQGATPAGLYYTAIFYLSDGAVNTQYWVVPAAAGVILQ